MATASGTPPGPQAPSSSPVSQEISPTTSEPTASMRRWREVASLSPEVAHVMSSRQDAIREDDLEKLKKVMSKDTVNEPGKAGFAALHFAACYGRVIVAKYLLEEMDADLSLPTRKGNTALHIACFEGHHLLIQLLVSHGARTDIQNQQGKTPAEIVQAPRTVQILLRALLDRPGGPLEAGNGYLWRHFYTSLDLQVGAGGDEVEQGFHRLTDAYLLNTETLRRLREPSAGFMEICEAYLVLKEEVNRKAFELCIEESDGLKATLPMEADVEAFASEEWTRCRLELMANHSLSSGQLDETYMTKPPTPAIDRVSFGGVLEREDYPSIVSPSSPARKASTAPSLPSDETYHSALRDSPGPSVGYRGNSSRLDTSIRSREEREAAFLPSVSSFSAGEAQQRLELVEELSNDHAILEDILDDISKEHVCGLVQRLLAQIRTLTAELSTVKLESETTELERVKSVAENERLRSLLKERTVEGCQHMHRSMQLETAFSSTTALHEELRSAKTSLQRLKAGSLAELKRVKQENLDRINGLTADHKNNLELLDKLNISLVERDRHQAVSEQEKQALHEEVEKVKEREAAMLEQLKSALSQIDVLHGRVDDLRTGNAEQQNQIADHKLFSAASQQKWNLERSTLENKVKKLEAKILVMTTIENERNEKANSRSQDMQKRVQAVTEREIGLRECIARMESETAQSQDRLNTMEEDLTKAERRIETLLSQAVLQQRESEELQNANDKGQLRVKTLESKLKGLLSQQFSKQEDLKENLITASNTILKLQGELKSGGKDDREALSRRLQKVEEDMETKLLERDTKIVKLQKELQEMKRTNDELSKQAESLQKIPANEDERLSVKSVKVDSVVSETAKLQVDSKEQIQDVEQLLHEIKCLNGTIALQKLNNKMRHTKSRAMSDLTNRQTAPHGGKREKGVPQSKSRPHLENSFQTAGSSDSEDYIIAELCDENGVPKKTVTQDQVYDFDQQSQKEQQKPPLRKRQFTKALNDSAAVALEERMSYYVEV